MKIRNIVTAASLSLGCMLALSACSNDAADNAQLATMVPQTMITATEPAVMKNGVCNVKAVAAILASGNNLAQKKFQVSLKADTAAQYNYYIAVAPGELNAESVRKSICEYVHKYDCTIYWGNVVSVGMFAARQAPHFPGDTSPHYKLTSDNCPLS